MKKQILLAVGMTAVGVVSLLAAIDTAWAFHAPFPTKARRYKAFMVRAMDECDPATISVFTNPGPPRTNNGTFPSGGCFQENIVTDEIPPTDPGGETMKFAKVTVVKYKAPQGKVKLIGSGMVPNTGVRVLLTLRTTRISPIAATHTPAGAKKNASVTYEDVTIQCGDDTMDTPKCWLVKPNGKLAKSMTLQKCLQNNGASIGFSGGNVEIVESGVVNCTTGKVFGRPGILNQ